MSVKLIILRPHFFNCRLRLINQEIMDALPMYEIRPPHPLCPGKQLSRLPV